MEKYTHLFDIDRKYYKHGFGDIWMQCFFPPEALESIPTFPLRETDILSATYPKTGQTWLLTILRMMENSDKLARGESIGKMDRRTVPFIEMFEYPDGPYHHKVAADNPDPRILKTHMPLCYWKDSLEKSPETKVISVVRNPKDTLVSYYHFYRMNKIIGAFNGTWDDFFGMVKDECILHGDFFKVTAEWYTFNKNRENSLVLVYEEMKKDLRSNVQKIAEFLGKKIDSGMLDKITEKAQFDSMSKDPDLNRRGASHFKEEKATFLRKGQVGDWQNYFNEEQNAYIEARSKEYLDPIGLKFEYV